MAEMAAHLYGGGHGASGPRRVSGCSAEVANQNIAPHSCPESADGDPLFLAE